MTPTCEATSGHCEVIATSLRHRKPCTFKASCGSSSKARRPAADVKRLEEDGIVVVAAAIVIRREYLARHAETLRAFFRDSFATFQKREKVPFPFFAFRVYATLGFKTFLESSLSGLTSSHGKEKLHTASS